MLKTLRIQTAAPFVAAIPATVAGTIAAAVVTFAAPAHGHQPWVLPDDAHIAPGESTAIHVYFGHSFPAADALAIERLERARYAGPGGDTGRIDAGGRVPFASPALGEPGTWVIGVEQARGYWTKTPDGGRPLPRSEVDEAVRCSYSGNAATTMVRVGDGQAWADVRSLDYRLEILPRADPTRLAGGDSLAVEVRFDGQPHAGPLLAFHAASGEEPFATVEADETGSAEIELAGRGPWMLLARAEVAYPDPAVCDVEAFHATLTFGGDR
jgi:uncharacterized GH25 family protein